MRRAVATVLLTVAAVANLTGCSFQRTLGPDSTCAEFMEASAADRDQAVMRIASDTRNNSVVSPLIRPNIEFMCAGLPTEKLGAIIERNRI